MSSVILFGRVLSTQDPDKLGRVQVEVVGMGRRLTLPWARVLQASASGKHGHLFLPEEGDEVVVLRGLDDRPEGLLVLGALYNAARPPKTPDEDGKNNLKEIRTRAGHALIFNDKSGSESVTLSSGDGKLSLTLDQKGGSLTLVGDKELVVRSKRAVRVDSDKVEVTGRSQLTLKGKSKVVIEGGEITLSGQKVKIA